MTILDYIILGIAAVAFVIGLVKGFVNQLMGMVTVIVVTGGTFMLYKYPEQWLAGVSTDPLVVTAIAIVGTVIVLGLACWLVGKLLGKLIGKVKALKAIDRILGALMSVFIVYCVVGAVVSFLSVDSDFAEMLRGLLGDLFAESWVVKNIYAVNPIGDLLNGFLGISD